MKRYRMIVLFCLLLLVMLGRVSGQSAGVTAEAIGQANLRAWTDVSSALLGQIVAGTRYPVVGRSIAYPWLLLGDPNTQQPIGWVFRDLVNVTGDISLVPITEINLSNGIPVITNPVVPTLTLPVVGVALSTPTPAATTAPQIVSTTTPIPLTGVIGTAQGEINIRYGPGVEYPRIGVARFGDPFQIIGRHTQFPWVQVQYSGAPNGSGWIAIDLLAIQGDIQSVPPISQTRFDLPTLTPTLPAVRPVGYLAATPVPISAGFQALGDQLWGMMLAARFEPETSRLGGLFIANLRSGEALTFGNDIAFSGMSLNKIAILTALYSTLQVPADDATAIEIANMMVCSENSASNKLLARLGNGDATAGAQAVTGFLQSLGLGNMYMVAPFKINPDATPVPVRAPTTNADQVRAQPDIANQMTVDDMGWLLNGLYQCAFSNSGPLLTTLPGAFDQRECRQMIDVMSENNLEQPLLMSAGVPASIRVAHKHGWTADTHGAAGIAFTPGGDYALVVTLHNPTWLDFSESFPLITDISRTVYNYFNPNEPLQQGREPFIVPVQECQVAGMPIINELTSYEFQN